MNSLYTNCYTQKLRRDNALAKTSALGAQIKLYELMKREPQYTEGLDPESKEGRMTFWRRRNER